MKAKTSISVPPRVGIAGVVFTAAAFPGVVSGSQINGSAAGEALTLDIHDVSSSAKVDDAIVSQSFLHLDAVIANS